MIYICLRQGTARHHKHFTKKLPRFWETRADRGVGLSVTQKTDRQRMQIGKRRISHEEKLKAIEFIHAPWTIIGMSEGLRNERKLFTHPGDFERLLYVAAGPKKGVAQNHKNSNHTRNYSRKFIWYWVLALDGNISTNGPFLDFMAMRFRYLSSDCFCVAQRFHSSLNGFRFDFASNEPFN